MRLGKFFVLIGLAALALLCAGPGYAEVEQSAETCYATGDANCEGGRTIADFSIIQNYFMLTGGTLECPYELDSNGDCVVDLDDYVLLLQCFSGIVIPELPDPCTPVPTCCNPIYNSSCCAAHTGDVNGEGYDTPTLADISTLVDFLFIDRDPSVIACLYEADVNQSGGCTPTYDDITLGDASLLIDVVFLCHGTCSAPRCLICP